MPLFIDGSVDMSPISMTDTNASMLTPSLDVEFLHG